jgi:two-component system response regulator RegA
VKNRDWSVKMRVAIRHTERADGSGGQGVVGKSASRQVGKSECGGRRGLPQTRLHSILLVDGERCSRQALALQFNDSGWSVDEAAGYAQALRSSAFNVPAYLIVDRDLVDGSGFGLFDRLRAVNPDLSAVMMTDQPCVTEAVRAIRAGFCDYRLKSFDCGDLLNPSAWRLGRGAQVRTKDPLETMGSLERVEWNHIRQVLAQARGNVSQAARVLGLHRRSLQRKLRKRPGEDRRDLDDRSEGDLNVRPFEPR